MFTRKIVFGFVTLLFSAGCGDGGSNTPTSPAPTPPPAATVPPPPSRTPADIRVSGSYECADRFCDSANYAFQLVNNGGADANLNFIRIENRRMDPVLELGADHFINTFGSNVLPVGGQLDFQLRAQLGFYVVLGYGDYTGAWIIRVELNPPR